ncbi:hypothetical protein [Paenisporosarcina indica]|nr:hypothetical protein [Paenisporosarcina indica]
MALSIYGAIATFQMFSFWREIYAAYGGLF